ncbi:putative polyprotein [Phytophthora infestans]|uniref:Putative polyprotein n=1 Tax=Phytophthora infestans TaxID=4787 RepID=A0A833T4H1_PHYIN|nr:putative polyprotein [Phytophthora infestans]
MLWARQLITEMTMEIKGPTKVLLDNKAAISMVTNSGYTSRAKHIELRGSRSEHTIEIEHVISKLQLADYLTKPLPTPQFATLVNKSEVVSYKVQEQQVEGEC